MKPAFLLLLSFVLAAALPLHAQSDSTMVADSTKSTAFGSYMMLPFEFPLMDASAMNQALNKYGLPDLKHPTASIGYGVQLFTGKIITNFSYNKSTRKDDNDLFRHEVEYRATSINLGYDLLRHYQFSLYPYVGYKNTRLNYQYKEKPQEIWSFEDYVQANTNSKEFTKTMPNLDLGLGWSFQTFYLLNVRAGYLVPLKKEQWSINNSTDPLRHTPAVTNRFYFVLSIGLGNIKQERQKKEKDTVHEQSQEMLLHEI